MSWDDLGELLQSCVGWSFHLRLGQDASEVGQGMLAHSVPLDECAQRLAQLPPQRYVIAIDHYPTPKQWRRRHTSS